MFWSLLLALFQSIGIKYANQYETFTTEVRVQRSEVINLPIRYPKCSVHVTSILYPYLYHCKRAIEVSTGMASHIYQGTQYARRLKNAVCASKQMPSFEDKSMKKSMRPPKGNLRLARRRDRRPRHLLNNRSLADVLDIE